MNKDLTLTRSLPVKILCAVLAALMVFSSGIISSYAQGLGVFDSIETHNILSESVEEMVDLSGVKSIDKEKTNENELYFNMKDGSTTVYSFSEPVTFIDENGNLKCKSASVSELNDEEKNALGYDYGNVQNDYRIYFSSDSSKGVLVEYKDFAFSMAPAVSRTAPGYISKGEICGREFEDFEYADLFGCGTYLKYFPQFNGVKEEIVLDEKINENEFSFILKTQGCTPLLNANGSISLMDSENNELQNFAAPFAFDSAYVQGIEDEHYTDECNYNLTETEENRYILTVTVSADWLNAESTVYPVTIDPTTVNHAGLDFTINYLYGKESLSASEEIMVGLIEENERYDTLVAAPFPSEINEFTQIHKAYYYVNELTGLNEDMHVGAHNIISESINLSEDHIEMEYSEQACDVVNINQDLNGGSTEYKFDITEAFSAPFQDEAIAFILKAEDEAGPDNLRIFAAFDSTDIAISPYIAINYTNDTTAPVFDNVTKSPDTAWNSGNVVLTVNGARDSGTGLAEKAYSFSTQQNKYNWQESPEYIASASGDIWIYIRDKAGNICYCSCESVKIDTTAPIIDAVTEIDGNEDYILLMADAADSESGVCAYSFSYTAGEYNWSGNNIYKASENGILYVHAKDETGNISSAFEYEIRRFDDVPPTVPEVTGNPDGWTNSNVTLTALSTDAQSGVAAYSFSTQKGVYEWQAENVKTFSESATLYVYAKDGKDNISQPCTVEIKIDKSSPAGASVSGNATNWTNNAVTLCVDNAADDISGLNAAAYSFSTSENEYEWQEENSKSFTSNCTVYVNVRDAAGNITFVEKTVIDRIDRTTPSVTVSRSDENGFITITADASDEQSGVALYSFDGGVTWQEENSFTFAEYSLNYVDVLVKDGAGNTAKSYYAIYSPKVYEENGAFGLYNPNPQACGEMFYATKTLLNLVYCWNPYTEPLIIPGEDRIIYTSFSDDVMMRQNPPAAATAIQADDQIGAYSESSTDAVFSYKNTSFEFARHYNSKSGWSYSFDSKLTFVDKGLIYGDMPDGSRRAFLYKSETQYYNQSSGAVLTLVYGESGVVSAYEITYNGAVYGYDTNGSFAYIADSAGNKITLSRTSNAIVFTDGAGRSYTAALDESANIISLTDPAGGVISYLRDAAGRLVKVTDQAGVILSEYEYNSNGVITKSSDKAITYDENGRVIKYQYDNGAYTAFSYAVEETERLDGFFDKVISSANSMYYYYVTVSIEMSTGKSYTAEIRYYTGQNHKTEKSVDVYEGDEQRYHLITDVYGRMMNSSADDGAGNTDYEYCEYDENGRISCYNDTYYSYDSLGRCIRELRYNSNDDFSAVYYIYDPQGNIIKRAELEITYDEYCYRTAPDTFDEDLTYRQIMEYTYTSGLLTKSIDLMSNSISTYQYDQYGNVVKAAVSVEKDGNTSLSVTDYTYDIMGNALTAQSGGSACTFIYDAAGRQLYAGENGKVTRTLYDNRGRVIQQIDPDVYNAGLDGLPAENTYADPAAGHTYVYAANSNLVSETTKYGIETQYSYTETGNLYKKHFDIYDYFYLTDGRTDKICVNGRIAVDYEYNTQDSGLTINDGEYVDRAVYANGDTQSYKYNENGTLIAIYSGSGEENRCIWQQSVNQLSGLPQTFNFETGDRYLFDEENNTVNLYEFIFDDYSTVPALAEYFSPQNKIGSYTSSQTPENEETGEPATNTLSGNMFGTDFSVFTDGSKIVNTAGGLSSMYSFETDEDGVVVSDGITVGESTVLPAEYSYDEESRTAKKLVNLTSSCPVEFGLKYDDSGMITESSISGLAASYFYDSYGQLARVNDNYSNYTCAYEYDSRGNMLSKKLYDFTDGALDSETPVETTSFTYANSGWKDQLVSVNSTPLTYDENGNLLSYGDKTYSWNRGTNLESITDGENEYSYVYDENGIRRSKTVNGETTQFNYLGGLLLSQKCGDDVIFFQYGTGGTPLGFVLNGVQYFYITNQLGDVIGIADSQGYTEAEYIYDEWGGLIAIVTAEENNTQQYELAQLNPLRYRGYYYDTETGYYYLQSRYYNPDWGRFISPDSFSYIENSSRIGFNAYVYCVNSPLMYTDPSGRKEVISTPQGDAIVQIIFSFIFIDGITDWIESTSKSLYNFLLVILNWNAGFLGNMLLMVEAIFSTLWDKFQNAIEEFTIKLTEKSLDRMTSVFDTLTEASKPLGEKVIKVNPIANIATFIAGAISTMKNNLYTELQKISLIIVDAVSVILPILLPGGEVGTSIIIDLLAETVKTLMESGFLIANGNILH